MRVSPSPHPLALHPIANHTLPTGKAARAGRAEDDPVQHDKDEGEPIPPRHPHPTHVRQISKTFTIISYKFAQSSTIMRRRHPLMQCDGHYTSYKRTRAEGGDRRCCQNPAERLWAGYCWNVCALICVRLVPRTSTCTPTAWPRWQTCRLTSTRCTHTSRRELSGESNASTPPDPHPLESGWGKGGGGEVLIGNCQVSRMCFNGTTGRRGARSTENRSLNPPHPLEGRSRRGGAW